MSLVSHHTISLDGYVAGPDDEVEWSFEYGSATSLAEETMVRIGAIVAGRRWYELALERWNGVDGIYGGSFDGRVFVVTHHPPEESGGARITFVSSGVEDAVAEAARTAAGKDVGVFGGSLTQQCLRAGLLDEIVLHVVPVLLGGGVRLFDEIGARVELSRVSVAAAEQVTDLRFRVLRR